MDVSAYLNRIGIATTSAPSLNALRELHRRHLLSVPFENLSMHSGEKIILDLDLVYDKIVVKRRGGLCYESNGIFFWVLKVLGYRPCLLSATVWNRFTGEFGPPSHMLLTVELEGKRWLCDVGYGEGIREPLPIESEWEEKQENGTFRLREDQGLWSLEVKEDSRWASLYKFTLEERQYEDFSWACEYHQTSPSSIFFCKSICSLQLLRGRVTYIGNRLISTELTEDGRTAKTTQVLTEEEIPALLRDRFGIVLNRKLVPKDDEVPGQATL
uniref:arylamine N-acetyltransferase n=1 Tax=Leptobrachium leishanense TaxID=445787 RepID=A0A8C5PKG9_9ANUR